jgi:DNA-binding MurR/RpiR family transcriptional regulator
MAGNLSGAERQVADYVCANAREVPYHSVTAVARAAKVSVASVTRLAKRLDYPGFREFKIALAQEVAAPVSALYAAVTDQDNDAEVVRKVFGGNVQSLENTLKMLDPVACTRVARLFNQARRIVFFGIGTSGSVGRIAALRLSHLGLAAEAYGDPYDMLIQAVRMRKGDVAVGISHSGRSTMTVNALALARKNGAATVGLSNFLRSPLHDIGDVFLCTSFPQTRVRSAALSAIAAQVCMLDALYVLTARYVKGGPGVDRVNALIEEEFRMRRRRT